MVPVWESRGRGCSGLPASLCPSLLVPVYGLFSAVLAQSVSGAPGLGGFSLVCFYGSWAQLSQVWWCQGEVMAAASRREAVGQVLCAPWWPQGQWSCSQTQIWRLGAVHCVLFLVCEPGTAQIPEGTSFGVQRTGRQFLHGFPFHPPVPSLPCAPVSEPAVTILVLEHESPFLTNCCVMSDF